MKVFVAGASGAIGQPLLVELVRRGHEVTAMTRSAQSAKKLADLGAKTVELSAYDAEGVAHAVRKSGTEVLIDELTALPPDPMQMKDYAAGDRKLRLEGGGNLYRAALANGVRRYIQQASGFFLKANDGSLADESAGLRVDATPGVAASSQTYTELESRVLQAGATEGVALRYGFFYGPKTWYNPDGVVADHVRQQKYPIVGSGQAVWSWIHIDDAALATVEALTIPAGVYNIVDDDPSPMSRWLPEFAEWVGAPAPRQVMEFLAKAVAGEDAVYYATKLSGASNAKAKRTFGFKPRRLEWMKG
jgi:2-alkyl-3-oxoalkanoate reductase